METNSKRLLEAIPDFTGFFELANQIKALAYQKMITEKIIKEKESETFVTVMNDPKYFVNGKAVPVSYFDNAYKHKGIDGSILPYREDLAEIISELDLRKATYDIYKQMLETWRTLSANERAT